MNKLLWIVGGSALAAAVYMVMTESQGPVLSSGEGVAGRLISWGSKQRAKGEGADLFGRLETGAAHLVGSPGLSGQGALDEAAGAVINAAGKAAQSLGNTVHELKK